ncbi:expressed unknown protein [Seminavis robusta]|uniref:Uncharacterized protein n=1 Tax=Seminavis robusta TaxID=568900 RepID=A0A9N8DDN6_9STRA|nr:expressed unknown protein [Seminavis robusta]|eukprot:Sro91_g047550.1 n/a (271) ;mRNA; f:19599-20411
MSSSSEPHETDRLLERRSKSRRRSTVKATSTQGPLQETAYALLESDDIENVKIGLVYLRRVWALTFMQYASIFIIASPFALLESVKATVEAYHFALEVVAVAGIIGSFSVALWKGPMFPFAHIALVSLTISVGLEIGISLATSSWGEVGLLAIGQATTNFALILAIIQFDAHSLKHFTYPVASLICLLFSLCWMIIMVEEGQSWKMAGYVGLGGWAFTMMNVVCSWYVSKEVAPEEYILAVLFMLFPEALLCLASKERHPDEDEEEGTSV